MAQFRLRGPSEIYSRDDDSVHSFDADATFFRRYIFRAHSPAVFDIVDFLRIGDDGISCDADFVGVVFSVEKER